VLSELRDKKTTLLPSLHYYYRHKRSVKERRERREFMAQEQSIATGRLALDDATVQDFTASLRGEYAQAGGETIAGVERYEVAVFEVER